MSVDRASDKDGKDDGEQRPTRAERQVEDSDIVFVWPDPSPLTPWWESVLEGTTPSPGDRHRA